MPHRRAQAHEVGLDASAHTLRQAAGAVEAGAPLPTQLKLLQQFAREIDLAIDIGGTDLPQAVDLGTDAAAIADDPDRQGLERLGAATADEPPQSIALSRVAVEMPHDLATRCGASENRRARHIVLAVHQA